MEVEHHQFDEHWEREPWQEIEDPSNARRIADIAALCPAVTSVLDVGCGNGDLLRALRGKARLRLGCDTSLWGLRAAQNDHPSRLAAEGDERPWPVTRGVRACLDRLPFADRCVELVTCCAVLEHLPDALALRALGELARVARRLVLIHVPLDEDLGWSQLRCPACGHTYHRDHHLRSYSRAQVRALLPDADFQIIAERTTGWRVRRPTRLPQGLGAWLMLGHDPTIRCTRCGQHPAPLSARRRLVRDAFVFAHNALTRPLRGVLTRDTDLVVLFQRRSAP